MTIKNLGSMNKGKKTEIFWKYGHPHCGKEDRPPPLMKDLFLSKYEARR